MKTKNEREKWENYKPFKGKKEMKELWKLEMGEIWKL